MPDKWFRLIPFCFALKKDLLIFAFIYDEIITNHIEENVFIDYIHKYLLSLVTNSQILNCVCEVQVYNYSKANDTRQLTILFDELFLNIISNMFTFLCKCIPLKSDEVRMIFNYWHENLLIINISRVLWVELYLLFFYITINVHL